MKMQTHWYLGFLGLIGLWKLPIILASFDGAIAWWGLSNALWFLWFLNFIPEEAGSTPENKTIE